MKIVSVVLFLCLSGMAYAQSPTPQQSDSAPQTPQTQAPSPTPQPSTTQSEKHGIESVTDWHHWELSGGYSHVSGYQGLDGFNVGGSVFLAPKISLGFNYDGVWDNSTLGAFGFTDVGLIASKTHLQNFLTGPRIYFPGLLKDKAIKGHILNPFAEAQFGESILHSAVTAATIGTATASDTEFTWLLGAGADVNFSAHWAARINTDFLRTHFINSGQSHLRLILGVAYRF